MESICHADIKTNRDGTSSMVLLWCGCLISSVSPDHMPNSYAYHGYRGPFSQINYMQHLISSFNYSISVKYPLSTFHFIVSLAYIRNMNLYLDYLFGVIWSHVCWVVQFGLCTHPKPLPMEEAKRFLAAAKATRVLKSPATAPEPSGPSQSGGLGGFDGLG